MLKIENISFVRNGRTILKKAHLTAQPGDIIELRGGNGAGKSTLINIIAGLVTHDSGSISINGTDISKLCAHKRARFIGMVHQDPTAGTVGNLTVEENLALALLKGKSATFSNALKEVAASHLMTTFKTLFAGKDILHQPVKTLSGGQRQLLACVMATAHKPAILLLDEPTAALDAQATMQLISFVSAYTLANKAIVIMITHANKPHDAQAIMWQLDNGALTNA